MLARLLGVAVGVFVAVAVYYAARELGFAVFLGVFATVSFLLALTPPRRLLAAGAERPIDLLDRRLRARLSIRQIPNLVKTRLTLRRVVAFALIVHVWICSPVYHPGIPFSAFLTSVALDWTNWLGPLIVGVVIALVYAPTYSAWDMTRSLLRFPVAPILIAWIALAIVTRSIASPAFDTSRAYSDADVPAMLCTAEQDAAAVFSIYNRAEPAAYFLATMGVKAPSKPFQVDGHVVVLLLSGTQPISGRDTGFDADVTAYAGFRTRYESRIIDVLRGLAIQGHGVVFIIGHSLGGMTAESLQAEGHRDPFGVSFIHVVTFGSPSTSLDLPSAKVTRFAADGDAVPRLPSLHTLYGWPAVIAQSPEIKLPPAATWYSLPHPRAPLNDSRIANDDGSSTSDSWIDRAIHAHGSYPKQVPLEGYDAFGNTVTDGVESCLRRDSTVVPIPR